MTSIPITSGRELVPARLPKPKLLAMERVGIAREQPTAGLFQQQRSSPRVTGRTGSALGTRAGSRRRGCSLSRRTCRTARRAAGHRAVGPCPSYGARPRDMPNVESRSAYSDKTAGGPARGRRQFRLRSGPEIEERPCRQSAPSSAPGTRRSQCPPCASCRQALGSRGIAFIKCHLDAMERCGRRTIQHGWLVGRELLYIHENRPTCGAERGSPSSRRTRPGRRRPSA